MPPDGPAMHSAQSESGRRPAFFGGFTRGKPAGVCPLCLHSWRRHDPENGCCDAHSSTDLGPCECGRDLGWMQSKIALLSRAELEAES